MSAALHERARRMRQRIALRSREYRQRHHAHGVWFRLRLVLAEAERVFVVSPAQVQTLMDEGLRAEPVGLELHPEKTIVFASAERISALGPVDEVPVRLSAEVLAARCLALVRFPLC